MKVLVSVGTRPEIIKLSPLIRILGDMSELVFIHSGQHYDFEMSQQFLTELGLPQTDANFEIEPGTQAEQTAQALVKFEMGIEKHKPDVVIVQGDTNTTLACALASAKLGVPVCHVEAGLRSNDRTMPEELNRILTDHLSEILFAPNEEAKANLLAENIPAEKIFVVGNTIADAVAQNLELARAKARLPDLPEEFLLLTLHRKENVDDRQKLSLLLSILGKIPCPIFFPIHPRTKQRLTTFGLTKKIPKNIIITPPVSYLEFLSLMDKARAVLTDSGGIQEECALIGTPCITLRYNTERPETLMVNNVLTGFEASRILKALDSAKRTPPTKIYWENVSKKIADILLESYKAGKLKIGSSNFLDQ